MASSQEEKVSTLSDTRNAHVDMFRPPINRAMRVLDKPFFRKTYPISAATVFDNRNIAKTRAALIKSKDTLQLERLSVIREDQDGFPANQEGGSRDRKCLLLKPDVKHDDAATWSPTIKELVEAKAIGMRPFELVLDYDHWDYLEIMTSILPEEDLVEIPVGFSIVGHVAHLNLREQYLPYKHLLAQVLLDKNPNVKTVINKLSDVGTHSEFRTFPHELLAGEDNLNVIAHEQDCEYRFNFADVYWNSRLHTEHSRLVEKFNEGEAVCDVMAGVGPFAIPAGKKHIFVYANDLNPASHASMQDAIIRNRVQKFVQASCDDGRNFIKSASDLLRTSELKADIYLPLSKQAKKEGAKPDVKTFIAPKTFDHYVMNLPATAIDFVDAYAGVYEGQEELFAPHTDRQLPMVHVYCFAAKREPQVLEEEDVCQRVSERLGATITRDTPETELFDVRLVAPAKRMWCCSFRLPKEIAFKPRTA